MLKVVLCRKDHSGVVEFSSDFVTESVIEKKQVFATTHSIIIWCSHLSKIIPVTQAFEFEAHTLPPFSICTPLYLF